MRAWLRRRRNATGTPAVFEAAAGCPVQSGRPGCRFLPALKLLVCLFTLAKCGERTLFKALIHATNGRLVPGLYLPAGTGQRLNLAGPNFRRFNTALPSAPRSAFLASRGRTHQTTYDKA